MHMHEHVCMTVCGGGVRQYRHGERIERDQHTYTFIIKFSPRQVCLIMHLYPSLARLRLNFPEDSKVS